MKALTLSGLSTMGIDVAVTDRATELKMTLLDYEDLKHITKKLAEVHADAQNPIYKQSADYIQSKVSAYPFYLKYYIPSFKSSWEIFVLFYKDTLHNSTKELCLCPNITPPCRYCVRLYYSHNGG